MAKVATPGSLTSNSLQIGGTALQVGPMVKRKTPSELRVSFELMISSFMFLLYNLYCSCYLDSLVLLSCDLYRQKQSWMVYLWQFLNGDVFIFWLINVIYFY